MPDKEKVTINESASSESLLARRDVGELKIEEKKIIWERMNETFHIKLYDDNTVDLVDIADKETINIHADKLPNAKSLIDELGKFRKSNKGAK